MKTPWYSWLVVSVLLLINLSNQIDRSVCVCVLLLTLIIIIITPPSSSPPAITTTTTTSNPR